MRDFTPAHISGGDRGILRPVALAYRRARPSALAEGVHFRTAEDMALAAAHTEFVQQRTEAATWTKFQVSGRVMPLIAAAINADSQALWVAFMGSRLSAWSDQASPLSLVRPGCQAARLASASVTQRIRERRSL